MRQITLEQVYWPKCWWWDIWYRQNTRGHKIDREYKRRKVVDKENNDSGTNMFFVTFKKTKIELIIVCVVS